MPKQSLRRKGQTAKTAIKTASMPEPPVTCVECGRTITANAFYKSRRAVYKKTGRLPHCKECLQTRYDDFLVQGLTERTAIYMMCVEYNLPFYNAIVDAIHTATGVEYNGPPDGFKIYCTRIGAITRKETSGTCFADGDRLVSSEKDNNKTANIDILEKERQEIDYVEAKKDVIKMIGYDVFSGYSEDDQKFLYNELLTYLDEDTLEDQFKLSQIIQLVNNNNQVRQIDLRIASLDYITAQGEIKGLLAMKKSVVESTDKIAKENSISVKNRGDKKAGRSTLTYLMKQYRELGFEDAEQDYYDQNKAYGIRMTADISNKSLLEQLQFDENDYVDIIKTQRELVEQAQTKIFDLEEEVRLNNVKIISLEKQLREADGG